MDYLANLVVDRNLVEPYQVDLAFLVALLEDLQNLVEDSYLMHLVACQVVEITFLVEHQVAFQEGLFDLMEAYQEEDFPYPEEDRPSLVVEDFPHPVEDRPSLVVEDFPYPEEALTSLEAVALQIVVEVNFPFPVVDHSFPFPVEDRPSLVVEDFPYLEEALPFLEEVAFHSLEAVAFHFLVAAFHFLVVACILETKVC